MASLSALFSLSVLGEVLLYGAMIVAVREFIALNRKAYGGGACCRPTPTPQQEQSTHHEDDRD